jgi:hypothetical protein
MPKLLLAGVLLSATATYAGQPAPRHHPDLRNQVWYQAWDGWKNAGCYATTYDGVERLADELGWKLIVRSKVILAGTPGRILSEWRSSEAECRSILGHPERRACNPNRCLKPTSDDLPDYLRYR